MSRDLPIEILQELEVLKFNKSNYTHSEYQTKLIQLKNTLSKRLATVSITNPQTESLNELINTNGLKGLSF